MSITLLCENKHHAFQKNKDNQQTLWPGVSSVLRIDFVRFVLNISSAWKTVTMELEPVVLTQEYRCVQNSVTSHLYGDTTYLAQKGSANSQKLLQCFSAFVTEEFVEKMTLFSWKQRPICQCEIKYKDADKRNDFRNVQMSSFCENV